MERESCIFSVFGYLKFLIGIWKLRWNGLKILIPKHMWKSKIGPLQQIWASIRYGTFFWGTLYTLKNHQNWPELIRSNKHTYTYTYLSLVQYTFRLLRGSCLPHEWEPDAIVNITLAMRRTKRWVLFSTQDPWHIKKKQPAVPWSPIKELTCILADSHRRWDKYVSPSHINPTTCRLV